MNISIEVTGNLLKYLDSKVHSGFFKSRSEVVRQAIREMIQDDLAGQLEAKGITIDEIEFYIPKKDKKQTKTKKSQPYQSFFIDGFKIMLGRDERENIYLLQNSKASDFWFHLQGQVSSHVIVSNTKKQFQIISYKKLQKYVQNFLQMQKGFLELITPKGEM